MFYWLLQLHRDMNFLGKITLLQFIGPKTLENKHNSQPFLNNYLTWPNLIYLEVYVFWNPYDVMLFWFCSQCFSISCGAGFPCSDFLVIFCRLWLPPRFWLRSTQELLRYHTPFVTLHSLLFCTTLFLTYTKIFQIVHVFRTVWLSHPFCYTTSTLTIAL